MTARYPLRAYLRAYWRERGVPTDVGPGLTVGQKLLGLGVLVVVGTALATAAMIPLFVGAWYVGSGTLVALTFVVSLAIGYLSTLYVGAPVADFVLKREIEGIQP